MSKIIMRRITGIILSCFMVISFLPVNGMFVFADETQTDMNGRTEITDEINDLGEKEDIDLSVGDEGPEDDISGLENNTVESERDTAPKMGTRALSDSITVDPDIINGSVTADQDDNIVEGTAVPDSNYDLASVRLLYGEGQEAYIDFAYKEEGNAAAGYSFSFDINDYNSDSITITATFFDNRVWDGAADISWYDPNEASFDISTPAQLAGLAVIVNGMTDPNETREDQIKSPVRAKIEAFVHSEPFKVQLLEQQGGGIEDIAWRQVPARETGILGEDDLYNDMRYRTINITSDIDMGTEHNYIPIGGKYAMIVKNDSELTGNEVKVIDARFHGIFNGNGHTITVNCNRYSSKGYGYTWNVGLIGYLGGGIDRELNSAKDNKVEEYAVAGYAPAVRNVVLQGSIKGRRGTGGIVGRVGQTNGTVIVEKCANYATVRGTDKVGCGGIVGAPWGRSVIRNCYNVGTIRCSFEEVGGIVGSNGYGWGRNQAGADIYNCFNVGDIQNAYVAPGTGSADEDTDVSYAGHDIGYDGNAAAEYTIRNCYYIEPDNPNEYRVPGYDNITNNNVYFDNMQGVTSEEMKNAEVLAALNTNGNVFVAGSDHPLLYFEKAHDQSEYTVSLSAGDHGKVKANGKSSAFSVPYGTTVDLSSVPDEGYRIGKYTADGAEISGNFYTVTGNVSFSGVFPERGRVVLTISKSNDYVITVKRIKDGGRVETLSDGAVLFQGDVLEVTGKLNEGVEPSDVNYEYTGRFGQPTAVDESSIKDTTDSRRVEVTGAADVTIKLEPKIQLKDWATYADTSWYYGHESDTTFTLTTPQQLAGMAKILCDGVDDGGTDFAGKTIKLGNDIDLTNPDTKGGNRLWRTVGNNRDNFKGIFDGCGHTISNIYVSHTVPVVGIITGNHGGLFGFTEGATIKNLTISGRFWATAGDTGVFVGSAKNTLIENCTSKVDISNSKETGGIVGKAEGSTVIRNCKKEGPMQGMYQLGGIVGKIGATGSGTNNVIIESCVNDGDISGTFYNNAGVAAICETKATISECVNYGNITCSQTAEQSDLCSEGGLIALVKGALTLDSCVNMGTVAADGYMIYAGGLTGLITVNTASIVNCYNSGDVTSNSANTSACVSGLANFQSNRYPKLENCYNRGKVTKGEKFKTNNYAGIAATGTGNKIVNTYCTNESVASIGSKVGIGGSAVASDKLKNMIAELGASYVKDSHDINNGFPVLAWQDPTAAAVTHIGDVKKASEKSVAVTWTAAGPRDGFELYRSVNGAAEEKVYSGPALSFTDSGLAAGNTYRYRVRAFRFSEGRTYFGEWSADSSLELLLNPMKLKSVKNKKKGTAEIKWKQVKNAAGYEIYRSMSQDGAYKKVKTVKVTKKNKKTKTLSLINKKLKKKKTYYFRIRYYRNVDGKKVYSEYSPVKKIKIKK